MIAGALSTVTPPRYEVMATLFVVMDVSSKVQTINTGPQDAVNAMLRGMNCNFMHVVGCKMAT
jgi:hypothetical protein